jgi:hypothetical protein
MPSEINPLFPIRGSKKEPTPWEKIVRGMGELVPLGRLRGLLPWKPKRKILTVEEIQARARQDIQAARKLAGLPPARFLGDSDQAGTPEKP